MSHFWNRRIQETAPYAPGEQPMERKYVKLNTNESPFPPSPRVLEKLRRFDYGSLRLYPDPEQTELRQAIAQFYGLDAVQVFVGNGSDEILALCFSAFFESRADLGIDNGLIRFFRSENQENADGTAPSIETNPATNAGEANGNIPRQSDLLDMLLDGKEVLTPEWGYSFYPVYADFFDVPLRRLPLRRDFSIRIEDYRRPARAVILANPNAPTGLWLSVAEIRGLLEQDRERLVIVDEAYVDFAPDSALSLLDQFDNLLLVRTFSKSRSLAGLRLGFAAGNPELIEGLKRARDCFNSYTVDRLAAAIGIAALGDTLYFNQCCAETRRVRAFCQRELLKRGAICTDSQANFIWLAHPALDGASVYRGLRTQGILVRWFAERGLEGHVRVTVGSEDEMRRFLAAYDCLEERVTPQSNSDDSR